MTPTPEATEALATALSKETAFKTMMARYGKTSELWWRDRAKAILAALPPGTVLTTVDDVARRLHGGTPSHNRAEAARLLGVTE